MARQFAWLGQMTNERLYSYRRLTHLGEVLEISLVASEAVIAAKQVVSGCLAYF